MDKIIPFNQGIRRQPSLGAEGELSECVNLLPRNGEMENVRGLEENDLVLESGEVVSLIHKVAEKWIYITSDNSSLWYREYDGRSFGEKRKLVDVSDVKVEAFGNMIVVANNDGYKYALWKNGAYHVYSDTDIQIGATIKNTYVINYEHPYDVTIDVVNTSSLVSNQLNIRGSKFTAIFQRIDGAINDFMSKIIPQDRSDKDMFKYVSFGVAALKGYDGEYISTSNIFSLDPTVSGNGITGVKIKKDSDAGDESVELNFTYSLHAHSISIDYSIPEDLMDIIQGVDVFLTSDSPFLDYDKGFSLDKIDKNTYQYVDFPIKNNSEIIAAIDGLFYKSIYIDKSELKDSSGGKKEHTLKRVTGGEQTYRMLDSDRVSIADKLFSYNSRLHVVSKASAFKQSSFSKLNQIYVDNISLGEVTDAYYDKAFDCYNPNGSSYNYNQEQRVKAVIKVNIGGDTKIIKGDSIKYPLPPILSYPSSDATSMELYINTPDGEYFKRTCKLESFVTSQQSVYINNDNYGFGYIQPYDVTITKNSSKDVVSVTKEVGREWIKISEADFNEAYNAEDEMENIDGSIIRYSSVENPMVMPSTNKIKVGQGDIKGLSTSAKALSEGQYGLFPLYVFCTDGVWALSVNDDGTYKKADVVSRDVCNNPDSITQIDGAVVFSTDQGLKLIQGSDVVLLTDKIEGINEDEDKFFGEGFFSQYGLGEYDNLVVKDTRDIREILKDCKIAYDYVNRCLRIFYEESKKYYVYSLDSQEFTTMMHEGNVEADGIRVVHAFPKSYIQIGNKVYTARETDDMDSTKESYYKKGLLLTRPLLLGEPFSLKKLQAMKLNYTKHGESSGCKVIVYVSNDGENWAQLTSLRGGSYKYFRIAVITNMTDADRLTGAALRYEINRANKLR